MDVLAGFQDWIAKVHPFRWFMADSSGPEIPAIRRPDTLGSKPRQTPAALVQPTDPVVDGAFGKGVTFCHDADASSFGAKTGTHPNRG